ncbi:MAG: tetratricopeptide repeat protein [Myxococcales bacterium]|nr:tetratricopeptide repeat protein [Myxococcales bacterium]
MRARVVTALLAPCLALALALAGDASSQPAPAKTPLAEATALLDASDYARAEPALKAITGGDAEAAQLALARLYFETGKYAEADRLAQQVGAAKPGAVVVRARVLAATGKVQDAIKLLEGVKTATGRDGRAARLLLGELRIESGKRADAEEPLMKNVEEYNDNKIADNDAEGLAVIARTVHLLRSHREANKTFNKAELADKKRVQTLLWRSELYLEKYDPGHAEEVVKEGLALAPKRADLLVMMARVKLEQSLDFDAADKLANDALAQNPKHTGAFAVKAGLALRDMDLTAADAALKKGLDVNPNDLELLSLRAAVRFLADDKPGYEAAKKEVFARNKEYSAFYGIVGDYAEWEHRYDDIIAMMKEAVKVDADDPRAWAQLGLTQMRGGDEKGGLDALNKAWARDKFNIRVFNTLNLYEQTIANQYELGEGGVFKVRYPKDERAMLERYVPQLLGEAWASMKSRYGFVPTVPIQVEMYGGREPFSVRTSGLPNVGIQGVCFGRVVASMSPKSEPFNWGNVLWHELGHVFAIQLSKNHVPRWFTEGLSEYETIARRPEWSRELDPQLYSAIKEGTLPNAVDMNRAFTHANSAADVTVAYYASSQMLVWTVERFGMPRVVEALKLWGMGLRTPDVLQKAFGVSASEYDAGFRAWAMKRLERYKGQYVFSDRSPPLDEAKAASEAAPNDAKKHVLYGLALLKERKLPEAKKEIERALAIDPKQMDAHFIAAKLSLSADKDVDGAIRHLDAIRAAGGDGYMVRDMYSDIAEARKDKAAMKANLEAAHRFDPSQPEPLQGLFDLAAEDKRDAEALDVLRKLAVVEQHDRKVWRMLLEKLVEAKQWDEAVRVGEGAIFVDVHSPEIHLAYGRALAQKGQHDRAIYELSSALEGKPKAAAAVHALLARSHAALKHGPEARKHKDEAERLDKNEPELKGLVLP